MGKLIQNERTKLYRKISTWVLMGVIVLLMAVTLILSKVAGGSSSWYGNWEEDYEETLSYLQMYARQDPEDLYTKYELKEVQYLYDNQIPPSDWRAEVIYRICNTQRQIEEAQRSQEEGGMQQPGQTPGGYRNTAEAGGRTHPRAGNQQLAGLYPAADGTAGDFRQK